MLESINLLDYVLGVFSQINDGDFGAVFPLVRACVETGLLIMLLVELHGVCERNLPWVVIDQVAVDQFSAKSPIRFAVFLILVFLLLVVHIAQAAYYI
jgi:hypothetical protein